MEFIGDKIQVGQFCPLSKVHKTKECLTVSLKSYSPEEIERMAMIDLANLLMLEEKKPMDFHEVFDRVADLKGLSKEEKKAKISQFYTDLNIDGRFMALGSNIWGLKRWYPVEQIDDEIAIRPKKKKKPTKQDDGFDDEEDLIAEEGFEEEEEDEEEFDDIEDFEEDEEDLDEKRFDDEDDEEEDVFAEGFGIEGEDEEDEEDEDEE